MARDRHQPSLPSAELPAIRRPVLRTSAFRIGLGLALVCTFVAALVVVRSRDAQPDPLLPAGTTAIIVLDLSASAGLQPQFGELLRRIAAANEPAGVVVFSDTAYELVPPGTPGRDLIPMIRIFTDPSARNPWRSFQTGTNLASGIERAQEVLRRDRIKGGTVLLASDLEFFPEDGPRLTAALVELRGEGTRLRILPLGAREEQKRFFEATIGSDIFIDLEEAAAVASGRPAGVVRLAEEATSWLLVGLILILILLLAANERACGRLRLPFPRSAGA